MAIHVSKQEALSGTKQAIINIFLDFNQLVSKCARPKKSDFKLEIFFTSNRASIAYYRSWPESMRIVKSPLVPTAICNELGLCNKGLLL